MRSAFVVFALLAVACGPQAFERHARWRRRPDAGLDRTVEPADAELLIDGSTPAAQHYTAKGTFEDGHIEDITDRVAVLLGNMTLGGFSGADFTSDPIKAAARACPRRSRASAARPAS